MLETRCQGYEMELNHTREKCCELEGQCKEEGQRLQAVVEELHGKLSDVQTERYQVVLGWLRARQ